MRRLRKALVVGGAGFLGSWLVETLARDGIEPVIVDSLWREPAEAVGAELVIGDAEALDLDAVLAGSRPDVVFQLAGTGVVPLSIEDPLDDLRRNTATTVAVLEAARRAEPAPLVCFVSSAAVYGESRRLPMDEAHPLDPVSPYGISKLAAERYVSLYSTLHGLETFSVRPFSLYGPRQRKLVIHDLANRLLDGEDPLLVMGAAEVSRDFVYVEDAAEAMVTLARRAPARGEVYNLASGRPTTLGVLVGELVDACGVDTEVRFTGVVRPGDALRWYGDSGRARALGARFEMPLREGIRQTVTWLAERRGAGVLA